MQYKPEIHHRRSIRLRDYDYSQAGAYFVTMYTHNKECLFGKVVDGKIELNNSGLLVQKWWLELKNKYPNIELDECIIMPNHLHGIITITKQTVGADLCVCPKRGEHAGSPLRVMIQWFKTMSTNEYIRGIKSGRFVPFQQRLWQRNYYEHIIRNEKSFQRISQYIINNPRKWNG